MSMSIRVLALAVLVLLTGLPAAADWVWVEGEEPSKARVTRHPQWYDMVKRDQLSGGDFISNWGDQPGLLLYQVRVPRAGDYDFWVRANPVQARLSYGVNGGDLEPIDLENGPAREHQHRGRRQGRPPSSRLGPRRPGLAEGRRERGRLPDGQREQQSRLARLLRPLRGAVRPPGHRQAGRGVGRGASGPRPRTPAGSPSTRRPTRSGPTRPSTSARSTRNTPGPAASSA